MLDRIKAKKLGQVFLVNRNIAEAEAEHAHGKSILEIGPGHAMLTTELCKRAKSVIAVEKDPSIYRELKSTMNYPNLMLINADFLDFAKDEASSHKIDMLIANVPYGLSSKVIEWLADTGSEAVLCLQKEFVERMLSSEGTREYSNLSVMSALSFSITEIMNVDRGNFSPVPKVDSEIIYLKPKSKRPKKDELKVISILMQHKKRTLRKALIDCRAFFSSTKGEMSKLSDTLGMGERRIFTMSPAELLSLAGRILSLQKE